MKKPCTVFISSCYEEFSEVRLELRRALALAGYTAIGMEDFPAYSDRPLFKCLQDVASSDILILLVGKRYGFRPTQDNPYSRSITHLEYEAARVSNRVCLVFLLRSDGVATNADTIATEDAADLNAFVTSLKHNHGCAWFSTSGELSTLALASLHHHRTTQHNTRESWPVEIDSQAFLAEKLCNFQRRPWLNSIVDDWLKNDNNAGLLFRAGLGFGKSSFLAELGKSHGYVLATHFCQYDSPETLLPGRFVRNLVAQLIDRLPGYLEKLQERTDALDTLSRSDSDPLFAFDTLLAGPLHSIAVPKSRYLIIVDAMDEAIQLDTNIAHRVGTIVSILATRIRRLPHWVAVLASTRPNSMVSSLLGGNFRTVDLDRRVSDSNNDIKRFLELSLDTTAVGSNGCSTGVNLAKIVENIAAKSEGMFLYASLVASSLARDWEAIDEVLRLPPGIQALYKLNFESRFARRGIDYTATKRLLSFLVAAPSAVDESSVNVILDIGPMELAQARNNIPDFVLTSGGRLRTVHYSLDEWLTKLDDQRFPVAAEYEVDTQWVKLRISNWLRDIASSNLVRDHSLLIAQLLPHAGSIEEYAKLVERLMLESFDWLHSRLMTGGVGALLADSRTLGDSREAQLLKLTIDQIAPIVERDPNQFAGQLLLHIGGSQESGTILRRLSASTVDHLSRSKNSHDKAFQPARTSEAPSSRLLRTFLGHSRRVTAIVNLSGGKIASASEDSSVRIWDLERERISEVILLEGNGLTALALVATAQLVAGGINGEIWHLDPKGSIQPSLIGKHSGKIVSITRDGESAFLSASEDGQIALWELSTKGCLRRWMVPAGIVGISRNSPDELAIVWRGGVAAVLLSDGSIKHQTKLGIGRPLSIAATGSQHFVVGCVAQDFVTGYPESGRAGHYLWNAASGKSEWPRTDNGQSRSSVCKFQAGFASGCLDGTIEIHDGGRVRHKLLGHSGRVNALLELDSSTIASSSDDGTIRVWRYSANTTAEYSPAVHNDSVTGFAVSRDGCFVSASYDGKILEWDSRVNLPAKIIGNQPGGTLELASLPDGRIASAGFDGNICIWGLDNPAQHRKFLEIGGTIDGCVVTKDGELLVAANMLFVDELLFLNLDDGSTREIGNWYTDSRMQLAVREDNRIAFSCGHGEVHLLNLSDLTVNTYHGNAAMGGVTVRGIVCLPAGEIVFSGRGCELHSWDPENRRLPLKQVFSGGETNAILSIGGDLVAIGVNNGDIHIFNAFDRSDRFTLRGHSMSVHALIKLSDDLIASGSQDSSIRLWSISQARQVDRFDFAAPVRSMKPSSDNSVLAIGCEDGSVHFIRL